MGGTEHDSKRQSLWRSDAGPLMNTSTEDTNAKEELGAK